MTGVETLNARDDLLELADLYEQVGALDPSSSAGGGSGVGPRVPPGVREILDADEVATARLDVDDWAGYCASIVASDVDERDVPMLTPALLRWLAPRADVMLEQDDEVLARSFVRELARYLERFRRLAGRGVRTMRTGMACGEGDCPGFLVSPLAALPEWGTDQERDSRPPLVCDRCGRSVPYVVWSGWPRARVTYVTVEHAARLLGTTVAGVKMRASRLGWRRTGTGREVRYHVDDVRGSAAGA